MTNGSDPRSGVRGSHPIDAAIDRAAHGMTAHAAPDLRARVAARLEHPACRSGWRRPAAAAAAAAVACAAVASLVWRAASLPADPPRATRVDIPLVPGPVADHARETAARTPFRPMRVDRDPDAWPQAEQTIEPLALAALTLEPIDASFDGPPAPLDVAPLALPPLALTPLAQPDPER